jgi:UDP-N-acetylmuramate dehydrogenase
LESLFAPFSVEIRIDEPLCTHTTIDVGGPCHCFLLPESMDALTASIRICKEEKIPYRLLGAGSNILFADSGYSGVIIATERLVGSTIHKDRVKVLCGEPLPSLLASIAQTGERSLGFLAGIPGTVGGAIAMNAGIPARSIGDIVDSVAVLDTHNDVRILNAAECHFGYRESTIRAERLPVLWASLYLGEEHYDHDAILARRRATQPISERSSGCVFKNPPNRSSGQLIEECGLKGFQVGMAKISEKHANFILNLGGAKEAEIRKLIDIVRQKVYKSFHISLELEIEVIDG